MVEEVLSCDQLFSCLLPEQAHFVADGVESEGGEIEHQQHVGQTFFSVSEVVLEVVSVDCEFVEGITIDFPSASCAVK